MRVHWLQHAEHEDLGSIGPWLAARDCIVTHTALHRGEPLPSAAQFDWLIVMGGPMNIYEHDEHPWLIAEKALLRDAYVMNKKILGICLGAQLLADALGARVTRNAEAEIGWYDVVLTDEGRKSVLFTEFPDSFAAFHWHGDTFAIPPGSANLMKSDACVNQAFAMGPRMVALQFHLEVRFEDAQRWLEREDLQPRRYVQPAAEILSDPARFERNNRLMAALLDRLATAS